MLVHGTESTWYSSINSKRESACTSILNILDIMYSSTKGSTRYRTSTNVCGSVYIPGFVLCNSTESRSTPVAQSAPRNLLTRWDVSSIPANGIFLTKN